jgi:REP element-mobilizing transposase RayT
MRRSAIIAGKHRCRAEDLAPLGTAPVEWSLPMTLPCGTMADVYLSLRVHLVWATRNRRPWLDPEWRPRLYACVENIVERRGGKLLCAGGVRDHIHLYVETSGAISIADLVSAIKANTTRWIHQSFSHRRDFRWQHGYGAFSVTGFEDEYLRDFIRNQEIHHRERAFTGELFGLLERHRIDYDPAHVLD